MTLADRVAVLDNGELQQIGTPLEIYNHPANVFVADFVGSPSMNFFDVELEVDDDGSGVLAHDAWSYRVSQSFVSRVEGEPEGTYTFGIRPENVRIAEVAAQGKTFEGTVDVIETMGSDNYIYLDVSGRECRIRAPPTANPGEGERIELTFDESDVLLFDPRTERNVMRTSEEQSISTVSESGQTA